MKKLEKRLKMHVCHVCRCWRPCGARHSAKACCCVLGYDHFCYFFGANIGVKNQLYYDIAVIGFNIGIPLCLVDLAHALIASRSLITGYRPSTVLTLPAMATSTIYEALFASQIDTTSVLLSIFLLWLILMWGFVLILSLQRLHKLWKASGADEEKKNE